MRRHIPILFAAAIVLVGGRIPAQASDATIDFLGQRFIPRRGQMTGLLGIGYDPLDDRVLSAAHTTRCGGQLMSNRVGDNGVAWDPVGQEFWLINNQREVYRYDGDDPEILFTIPETILVPGVGAADVDVPEGLAMDEEFVYVLDAGPSDTRGELESNEWFKFTREGTPVSSSGANDFVAQLQPHFDAFGDCIVDGMTWIPPGAPFGEGLFLVAIEHTGFQVIDADGNYVDRFIWQEEGLPVGSVPFGFAGIAIDPERGDLYLVDNGSDVHVWERLVAEGPTSVIFGAARPTIHYPVSECANPPVYDQYTGNYFSLTYRETDGLLYTSEFNSGEILVMDPLYMQPVSLGFSGVIDSWGMAWDDERDVIYMYQETTNLIYALDPETLAATPLPNPSPFVRELAFDFDDKHIYGVGSGADGPVLVRIDRDTGLGTEVGPTVYASGIAYDRASGVLVGIDQNDDVLYGIDPATGLGMPIGPVVAPAGWEGLAAVPVGDGATAVEPVRDPRIALRAFPNPLVGRTTIAFDMPRAGPADVAVYDLRGRRVAELEAGELAAGPQRLHWNARDAQGRHVASGVYLVQVTTPWHTTGTRVTVLR